MLSDLRYAFRQLVKSPGFTVIAVLSLALGIGAGTAIFSALNAVLLRSLPVQAPHELRLINWTGLNPKLSNYTGNTRNKGPGGVVVGSSFPYPAYQAFRDQDCGLASIFAFFPLPRITAVASGEAAVTSGLMVSGNFFAGYGTTTLIGRPLALEDDKAGAAPVAVITYGMWERRFGLDPQVLGQTLTLNQNTFRIIGVLPRNYVGPLPGDPSEFYVSFAAQPTLVPTRPLNSTNGWWVQLMARVAPNTNEQQAQAALAVALRQVLETSETKFDKPNIMLQSGAQGAGIAIRERLAKPMYALLALVGIVLAIACANVAGLMLARGAVRQHEFAVRAAMGASRWHLLRQSFVESLLLGLAAAVGGLLFAEWVKAALLRNFGGMLDSFQFDVRIDSTVLAFTIGLSALTAVVFGLLPALRASRVDPLDGLKNKSASAAPRMRLGKVLVTAQVALSVLLVVGAGLMMRTFLNLVRVDPGFNPENILLFRVSPSQVGYTGPALNQFYVEAQRSLEAIPGVRSVALSSMALTSDSSNTNAIVIPSHPAKAGEHFEPAMLDVSESFFTTLGIPLVLGRNFTNSDTATSMPVAVVNETFARTYFPGENPLGQTFQLSDGKNTTHTIVGVSRDTKYSSIRDAIPPLMHFSVLQHDQRRAIIFAIRSVLPPLSLVPAARAAIAKFNPNLPISAVRTQQQLVEQSIAPDRLFAALCSMLAGLAILLSCIGLYGLMAFNVTSRTREFGVRMALGATRRNIAWPILRETLLLTAIGLALGVPVALAIVKLVKNQLYGVSPTDPLTLIVGALLLTAVAVVAAWLPARRATKVNPIEALRAE